MARLISGDSDAVIAENVRSLTAEGYSETEALARALRHAGSGGADSSSPDTPGAEDESGIVLPSESASRRFVIVTKDFSGLGWGKVLQDAGEDVTVAHHCPETDPKDKQLYDRVGEGWIPTMPLAQAKTRLVGDNTYWIFAENNFPEVADALRKRGQRVFGTSALSDKLEHDRHYAIEIANRAGLKSPPTEEFASRREGISFLQRHSKKAYVFKPYEGQNFQTFVPIRKEDADANLEVLGYLEHLRSEPGSFVLQERVQGIEANIEVWMEGGRPFFAFVTVEAKRKNPWDLGEMSGCAGDFLWQVPLGSPIVQQTVGLMMPFYREQKYTGFADVNVLLTDKGPMFLEVCNRFGYNAHVTLFLGLANDPVGDILADFMDGKTEGMKTRFQSGVAGSMTLFLDHPREGLPIHVDPRWDRLYYPFDGYLEEDQLLLTGYSSEVGIVVGSGSSIPAVSRDLLARVHEREGVSFPDMYYRTDLGESGYPNACVDRYQRLRSMRLW